MSHDSPLASLKAHLAGLFEDRHAAFERLFTRLETRLVSVVTRTIRTELKPVETTMSAQSEAFRSAVSDFAARIGTLQSDFDAKIAAAVAAQKAKDDAESAEDRAAADAQFKDATDALSALSASLPGHVEVVTAAAEAAPAPAAETQAAPAVDASTAG